MKKGVVVWLIIIAVFMVPFFLFYLKVPSPACDDLTHSDVIKIIGAYKDFSYLLVFLMGLFFGWISYKSSENAALRDENVYKNWLYLIPAGLLVSSGISMGFYILAPKYHWLSLDLRMDCKTQWAKMAGGMSKIKSFFGKFVDNFYLAHLFDVILLFVIFFFVGYFLTYFLIKKFE